MAKGRLICFISKRFWLQRYSLCIQDDFITLKWKGDKPPRMLVQTISGSPWARIAIDVLGPFPLPKALPILHQASTVVETLENVIARHGASQEFYSDQGQNFESEVWHKEDKNNIFPPSVWRSDWKTWSGNNLLLILLWLGQVNAVISFVIQKRLTRGIGYTPSFIDW